MNENTSADITSIIEGMLIRFQPGSRVGDVRRSRLGYEGGEEGFPDTVSEGGGERRVEVSDDHGHQKHLSGAFAYVPDRRGDEPEDDQGDEESQQLGEYPVESQEDPDEPSGHHQPKDDAESNGDQYFREKSELPSLPSSSGFFCHDREFFCQMPYKYNTLGADFDENILTFV